jgi:hypothetical protein
VFISGHGRCRALCQRPAGLEFNNTGINSIVYIVDGPEALSRGASVRIALEGGGNARTVFAPPTLQGASIEDIAIVRY